MATQNTSIMIQLYLLSALSIVCLLFIQGAHSDLSTSLQRHKVSPDLISTANLDVLEVEIKNKKLKPGDNVPVKTFQDFFTHPSNKFLWNSGTGYFYSIFLLDLDRRPTQGSNKTQLYNLFTVINVPGNSISSGQNIAVFDKPEVECEAGKSHRILLLAALQRSIIEISDVVSVSSPAGYSKKRENFDLKNFLIQQQLEPYAANIFLAQGESGGVCSGASATSKLALTTTSSLLYVTIFITTTLLASSYSHLYTKL